MSKTVVGLFSNYEEADSVVRDLQRAGFQARDISVVANQRPSAESTDTEEVEHLGTGVGTGAALGGIAGLILGLGALAIPGIGPIIAAGPIAAALTGAGIGAAAGGLLGTLSQMGVPEDEANFYAEGIRRGGALVAVHSSEAQMQAAVDVLNRHNAVDVDERDGELTAEEESDLGGGPAQSVSRASTATGMAAPPVQTQDTVSRLPADGDSVLYQSLEQDFRNHHATTFYNRSRDFNEYEPAYQLGTRMASERRYSDREFSTVEGDIRGEYERVDPSHTWEDVKDAVRYS